MAGESGWLPLGGQVDIQKAGTLIGTRSAINLIEGTGATLTVTDDAANDRVNVTVSATGGGGGSGAMTLIEEIELGSAGTILFDNIPATYSDLLILGSIKNAGTSSSNTASVVRVGSGGTVDSGGSSYRYRVDSNGSVSTSSSASLMYVGTVPPSVVGQETRFGPIEFRLPDYTRTDRVRSLLGATGEDFGAIARSSSIWTNVADPIDVIEIAGTTAFANLAAGSIARLYGIS